MRKNISNEKTATPPQTARGALLAGGVSALLASTCCLGPLVLITLGFSGAWIVNLTALEPYRPVLMGVALVALFFAWRRIWRPALVCIPGNICAVSQVKSAYKLLFGAISGLVVIAFVFPYVAPWLY
ncbi:mercuric ion transporter MerT [Pollutimonas sp. H1-120]|uniref:mercuric ion transporter MerT n=1 Tax=Pollutimonas sp. H1-120 TaxID=3148824 RepID=UPI003B527602